MKTVLEETLEINFISQKPYLMVRASVTSEVELNRLIEILKVTRNLFKVGN